MRADDRAAKQMDELAGVASCYLLTVAVFDPLEGRMWAWRTSRARRRPRPTLVRQPSPRAHSRRDLRRMRRRTKASDHRRMPTAVARGLRTRLDPLPARPPALHQNHRASDPVRARSQPQIPPLPSTRPQPPSPRPTRLPRQPSRPHLLGITTGYPCPSDALTG